jgi:hypothetical protein
MLRNNLRELSGHSYPPSISKQGQNPKMSLGFSSSVSFPNRIFTFLNQSHTFKENINWNFNKYGKLWTYKLNCFEYLFQEGITKEQGLELIHKFINQIEDNREGLEPYPISLRGINWIKFFSKHGIDDASIDESLYAQYQILMDNLEYHILGNHLMENGCSLLFGAYYFIDRRLLEKAKKILTEQLKEQILSDGGHFERSTMYHLIMLERLMDCYNLIINNDSIFQPAALEGKLRIKIELMLGWMDRMTVDRGPMTANSQPSSDTSHPSSVTKELPLLNDAALGTGPSVEEIMDYANRLELNAKNIVLSESGYRKIKNGIFELVCDVGNIGPDYIPGHAHSDTLSFVLYYKGVPVIIDPGISTYENNDRRQLERSTAFHNTVQLDDKEQSEVWSAFRVGRRANVHNIYEQRNEHGNVHLSACHNGYQKWGVKHKRSWTVEKEGKRIVIKDQLIGNKENQGILNLHFHHAWMDKIIHENGKIVLGDLTISFKNEPTIKLMEYHCPNGYNSFNKSIKARIIFTNSLTSFIDSKSLLS